MNSTPWIGIHWQQVKRDKAAAGRHALRGNLRPAAGRRTEIDHRHAGLQQVVLVVDFAELEGGARAPALGRARCT
jgi:hypothetical protein